MVQGFLRLATADGHLLNPTDSLRLSGLQDGDCIAAVAQQPKIATSGSAFALWCVGGDRIVTWGEAHNGADSSTIRRELRSGLCLCCALGRWIQGSVVTWGHGPSGGDSSRVQIGSGTCSRFVAHTLLLPPFWQMEAW